MAKGSNELRKRVSERFNNSQSKSMSHKKSKSRWRIKTLICNKVFGVVLLSSLIVAAQCYYFYKLYLRSKVNTPLNEPKLVPENWTRASIDPWSFWGTYRSQLYFGLKTRHPQSPVFGLIWMDQSRTNSPPSMRHWCNQDDRLLRYGWLKHDGQTFGIQELEEVSFIVRTEFVKRAGGDHGGDWSSRISVKPKSDAAKVVSLMFYMALDGQGRAEPILKKSRFSGIKGVTADLGYFSLDFSKPKNENRLLYNYLFSYIPGLDKITDVIANGLTLNVWDKAGNKGYFALGGRMVPRDSSPNIFVIQITGKPPFDFDVIFESGSFYGRQNHLTSDLFSSELKNSVDRFHKHFSETFKLDSLGYKQDDISVAQSALSNMLGGIGIFHGTSVVKSSYSDEPVSYWPTSLHAGVPSRSFFPRGFLWDDGFHNLLINVWDMNITRSILSHWLDTLNIEGWIPREQILGREARAKVPDQFVVQKNENANPPTLFLPIIKLVNQLRLNKENFVYLRNLFKRLKVWYNWYNTTQAGNTPGTYRWRGRDSQSKTQLNPLTLTSGLDDYPRASHPDEREYHVDLRCWMVLASSVMAEIADIIGEDATPYKETETYLSDNDLLDELHWSGNSYSDFGLHTEGVQLQRPKPKQQHGQPVNQKMDFIRVVTKEPQYSFVPYFGYVSLYPLFMKIINPHSQKLGTILESITDQTKLWTNFGLRSLSQSSPFYGRYNTEHDPPYWRGRIWINLNYLAVAALHHYSNIDGPYRSRAADIYAKLRYNIITNVIKQYRQSGYIWEQYDDKTGGGKGSHPFTGWSATFVLMMAEIY